MMMCPTVKSADMMESSPRIGMSFLMSFEPFFNAPVNITTVQKDVAKRAFVRTGKR